MKIGLVNDYSPATGIGNYAFSLFSELKEMEKDVDMLYLQYKEPLEVIDRRIKVIETPFKLPVLTKTLNWYYYFPKKIPEGYDIYHVSSQYLSKVAKYRKPCVVSCMDIFPAILEQDYPYPLRFMVKKALRYLGEANAIIAISEYSKKLLVDRLNIPENQIHVVYLGVDTEAFKPLEKEDARRKIGLSIGSKIILHVGSEEPRKNVPLLIKAFYEFQKKIPDSMLIRIGNKDRGTEKLIKKFKIEDKIKYYANLSSKDIALFYNAADLFVFPSTYEGFGLPVLESMTSGTPVITSNAGSLPEIVGESRYMIDPLDVEGLTNNIYDVLTNEKISKKLIEEGLNRSKLFSWNKTAMETLKVYEDVT